MSESGVRVFLVEDSLGDTRLLREMLRDPSPVAYTLRSVRSMRAAETYLAANAVDILLLDFGLPDANGLQVLERARAAAPNVPVIVLTGRDDDALASTGLITFAGVAGSNDRVV